MQYSIAQTARFSYSTSKDSTHELYALKMTDALHCNTSRTLDPTMKVPFTVDPKVIFDANARHDS